MATSDKHAGCIGFMANSYVRRPCCCFWGFLVFYVLVAFLGAAALLRRAQSAGQTSVFSDGTSYDWSVSGKPCVTNGDMARMARDVANDEDDYPTARRLLQDDEEVGVLQQTARETETEAASFLSALDESGLVAGLAAAHGADASVHSRHALASRALSESGSGEEEEAAERSRTAGGRFSTMFLYLAKEGVDDIMTAPILKQMCEVENAILGSDDYGKVCHNSSSISSSTYTTDATGRQCTMPTLSIVSLFYMLWDDSIHGIAATRAAALKLDTAMAQISAIVSGTSDIQTWWNTGSNSATISTLATAVTEASTTAAALNPGGSYASAYSALITGVDAYVAQLPSAAGYAYVGGEDVPYVVGTSSTPALYSMLSNLRSILGFTADLPESAIDGAIVFSGMPFKGLPTNAPIKGTDTFVQADSHERNCVLLDADYVAARSTQLFDLAHSSTTMQNAIGFFLAADALAMNKTSASRGIIDFGRPRLPPYESNGDFEEAYIKGHLEKRLWDHFGMTPGFMKSAYRDPATTADLTIKYSQSILAGHESDRIINEDFLMVIFCLGFVFFYLCFHTGSFPLGCFAIMQIILSVPLALFIYVPLLNVPYFAQVHILAIFLCLGVGADDVFVYYDAWRQSEFTDEPTTLVDRVHKTYERTFFTVFNTSFTTAIAFFACATASIMPIASFGIFAASAIVFNWVLTVTFWPSAVLVWELYFCRARGIGCCFSCEACCRSPLFIKDQTSVPFFDANAPRVSIQKDVPAPENARDKSSSHLSCTERFFHDHYAPALNWSVGPPLPFGMRIKPFSYFLVLVFGIFGIYLTSEALTLTTPDNAPVWFPADHMVTGLSDLIRDTYLAGEDEEYMRGQVYFGIAGVDAPLFSKWTPAENRGTVVFDDNFNLSVPEAQAKFIELCADLAVEDCINPGESVPLSVCARPPFTLVSTDTVDCFLKDWQDELALTGASLPTGPGFESALHAWLQTDAGEKHESSVGFVNGTVRFAIVNFRWTAQNGIPVRPLRVLYERTMLFLDNHYTPIPELARPFVNSPYFSWMETSEELVLVVLQGFAIIYPCAFLIVFISSGSILTATYTIISLVLITGSLLGGVKLAFGFALGIKEAIAGNIVIGLAIDYPLHLSHAYMFGGGGHSREDKVTHAATAMGVTVVAGCTTTLGSALFMSPCQFTFFTDMVILIGGTVGFSIIYALFFFMPLMAIAGPTGQPRSLYGHVIHCIRPSEVSEKKTSVA